MILLRRKDAFVAEKCKLLFMENTSLGPHFQNVMIAHCVFFFVRAQETVFLTIRKILSVWQGGCGDMAAFAT